MRLSAVAWTSGARRWLRLARTIVVISAIAVVIALATRGDSGSEAAIVVIDPGTRSTAPSPEPAPEPAPMVRPEPVHIRASSIGVDAMLVPVGILEDDVMEVPEDVATVGWYDPQRDPDSGAGLGVIPGVPGTAVLAGHVDSRTQGRGALYQLRELRVGDVIEIDHADGTSTSWRVTEVIRYPKVTLPYHEVFTWSGPPRLALITCGGEFDRTARSYSDNIVAYAEPLDGSDGSPA
jgi:hypothetical protein